MGKGGGCVGIVGIDVTVSNFSTTSKPVLRGHLWDKEKVVF